MENTLMAEPISLLALLVIVGLLLLLQDSDDDNSGGGLREPVLIPVRVRAQQRRYPEIRSPLRSPANGGGFFLHVVSAHDARPRTHRRYCVSFSKQT